MKCDKCDNPATVHLIEIVDGQKMEKHLCEQHAASEGIVSTADQVPPINELVEKFLLNSGKSTRQTSRAQSLECDHCGMTYPEFRKRGLLGCPHCYTAFESILERLLQRAHEGASGHVGKVPARAETDHARQARLLQLRQQLADAIEQEQYEKAARIRDGIRQIEAGAE